MIRVAIRIPAVLAPLAGGPDTLVADDAEISILPAVSGGAGHSLPDESDAQ